MYLSYFGMRVTDLRRSADFYMRHFGLVLPPGAELPAAGSKEPRPLLLVDPRSGLRIELNYYPEGSPYAVPYVPGEGLDHLAFRVEDLERTLETLRRQGVSPEGMKHYSGPMLTTPQYRVAYIRDPDGNQIELYDTPGDDASQYDRNSY